MRTGRRVPRILAGALLAGGLLTGVAIAAPAAAASAPVARVGCNGVVVDGARVLGDGRAVARAAAALTAHSATVRVRTYRSVPDGDLDAAVDAEVERCASWHDDDGNRRPDLLVLAVSLKDRRTGVYYGDAWTSALDDHQEDIQNDTVNPLLKRGQHARAVTAGLTALERLLRAADDGSDPAQAPSDGGAVPPPGDGSDDGSDEGTGEGAWPGGLPVVDSSPLGPAAPAALFGGFVVLFIGFVVVMVIVGAVRGANGGSSGGWNSANGVNRGYRGGSRRHHTSGFLGGSSASSSGSSLGGFSGGSDSGSSSSSSSDGGGSSTSW